MNKEENDIVYVQIDNWNDMGEAEGYLKELESGKHDDEVNYCEVWYDMAIIYCITTTRDYIDKHPELEKHIEKQDEYFKYHNIFRPYFPDYDPDNFGCSWYGEYEGWAPYKEFNKQLWDHLKEQGMVDENGNIKTNKSENKD